MTEVKDQLQAAFNWVTSEGALCQESTRGIRYNIHDVLIHSDPSHRGQSQVYPACRRAFYASQLTAAPVLQEPIYLVDIQTPDDQIGQIYTLMGLRRGEVINEEPVPGTPLMKMQCHLPVNESFGFT